MVSQYLLDLRRHYHLINIFRKNRVLASVSLNRVHHNLQFPDFQLLLCLARVSHPRADDNIPRHSGWLDDLRDSSRDPNDSQSQIVLLL